MVWFGITSERKQIWFGLALPVSENRFGLVCYLQCMKMACNTTQLGAYKYFFITI